MPSLDDFYRTLDLPPGAGRKQVRLAHRDLCKVWHPDRFQQEPERIRSMAEEKLKQVNEACQTLLRSPGVPEDAPGAGTDEPPLVRPSRPKFSMVVLVCFVVVALVLLRTGLPLRGVWHFLFSLVFAVIASRYLHLLLTRIWAWMTK